MALKNNTINDKVLNICQYLIAFLILFNCRTMYLSLSITPGKLPMVVLALLVFVVAAAFMFNKGFTVRKLKSTVVLSMFLLFYLTVYVIFQSSHQSAAVKTMVAFMSVLIYIKLFDNENRFSGVLKKYKDIVFAVAVCSLFFWIFGSILNIIKPSNYVWTTWTVNASPLKTNCYYYLYFEAQTSTLGGLFDEASIRNTAIFTEAPMASFNFSIAFMFESLFEENRKLYKQIILALAIVSTLSASGYCVLIGFLVMEFIKFKPSKEYQRFIKFFLAIAFIIGASYVLYTLIAAKNTTKSADLRKDDFVVCFKTWLDYPILGCGIGNNDAIIAHMAFWRNNLTGLANSPGQILAQGGLWIFSLYFIAIFNPVIRSIRKKDKNKLLFLGLFAAMFTVTVVSYNYLTFYILCWMALNKNSKNSEIEKIIGGYINGQK